MSEQNVTSEDGEVAASHFPDFKIVGGPHPQTIEVEVDGKLLPKLTGLSMTVEMGDVVRVTTTQIASLADVQLRAGGWERHYAADVRVYPFIPGEGSLEDPVKVEGKGPTPIGALKDAVKQLEALEEETENA